MLQFIALVYHGVQAQAVSMPWRGVIGYAAQLSECRARQYNQELEMKAYYVLFYMIHLIHILLAGIARAPPSVLLI